MASWEDSARASSSPLQDWEAEAIGKSKQQTPAQPDTKSAMFPRTAKGADEGRSYPRQVMNAGADLLSLAGRGAAAAFDKDRGYKESLADTQGGNIVSKIVRDPGTMASAIASPIAAPLAAGIKGAGLFTTLARAATIGAGEGVASAAAHQAENVGAGKNASLADAALETGVSAAVPVGVGASGEVIGGLLKASGKKILDSAIKPAKKLVQGQGSKFDVQNIFDQGLDSPMGLKAMDQKIADFHSQLNDKYGTELGAVKDGVFNAGQAFKEAVDKAKSRLAKGRLTPDEEAGIKHGMDSWANYLDNSEFIKAVANKGTYSLPGGTMPPDAAVALRGAVQKAAKFDRTDPKAVKGAELFAQDFQSSMNDQLSKKYPQLRKIDAEFAKLHPVERGVDDAMARTAKNYGVSLLDLGGVGALAYGAASGNENSTKGGLASLLVTRGIRSPGAASALYRTGEAVAKGNPAGLLLRKIAGRAAAQNFRGDQ